MTAPTRSLAPHLLVVASLSLSLAACKHECEEKGGEIPEALGKAGVIPEGGTFCGDFSNDAKAAARVYYSDEVVPTTLAFLVHLGKNGWTRVACKDATLESTPDESGSIECFTKGSEVVNLRTYSFGHHVLGVIPRPGTGALIELDPADPSKRP